MFSHRVITRPSVGLKATAISDGEPARERPRWSGLWRDVPGSARAAPCSRPAIDRADVASASDRMDARLTCAKRASTRGRAHPRLRGGKWARTARATRASVTERKRAAPYVLINESGRRTAIRPQL